MLITQHPFYCLRQLKIKIWQRPTLPHFTAVPSALVGLTSLFGMGRGGPHRNNHQKILSADEGGMISYYSTL